MVGDLRRSGHVDAAVDVRDEPDQDGRAAVRVRVPRRQLRDAQHAEHRARRRRGRGRGQGAASRVRLLRTARCAGQPPLRRSAAPAPRPARIVKLDPGFDAIVACGSDDRESGRWLRLLEGPVWMRDGSLVLSDVPGTRCSRSAGWAARRGPQAERLRRHRRAAGRHIGSNGLTLDKEGRLIIAEHGNRRVSRGSSRRQAHGARRQVRRQAAEQSERRGREVDGAIYFTDPPYGLPRAGQRSVEGARRQRHLPAQGRKLELLSASCRGRMAWASRPMSSICTSPTAMPRRRSGCASR